MNPASPMPETFSRTFYVALLATLLFAMGLTLVIPIVPLYITEELDAGDHWIGTATMFVALTAVVTRIPSGALSDRQGRRRLMLIGAGLGLGSALLYIFSVALPIFLAARVLTGLAIGLFTTASKALSADLAPASRRGEAMGLNNAAFTLSQVASPVMSEGLKNEISFQAVFVASALLMLVALAITWVLPSTRPDRTGSQGASRDVKTTLRERGIWASILSMFGLGAVLALIFTFYPLLAERKDLFHDAPGLFSSVAMGIGLSIWALTDTLIEPVAGRISDRIGRAPVMLPGMLICAIGVVLLSHATNTLATYAAIAILAGGWGIARAVADAIAQDAVAPVLRGIGAAAIYTAFDLAVGVDAQLLSSLIDGSDFTNFFYAVLVLLLSFGLSGLALSRRLITFDQRAAAATGD